MKKETKQNLIAFLIVLIVIAGLIWGVPKAFPSMCKEPKTEERIVVPNIRGESKIICDFEYPKAKHCYCEEIFIEDAYCESSKVQMTPPKCQDATRTICYIK